MVLYGILPPYRPLVPPSLVLLLPREWRMLACPLPVLTAARVNKAESAMAICLPLPLFLHLLRARQEERERDRDEERDPA